MARKTDLKKSALNKIHQYINLLKEQKITIWQVILFGSYAKKRANSNSDIDLAIVSPQFRRNNLKEFMALRKFALKVDSRLEPIPLSPDDLKDHFSTLIQEIKRYGIIIH